MGNVKQLAIGDIELNLITIDFLEDNEEIKIKCYDFIDEVSVYLKKDDIKKVRNYLTRILKRL